MDMMYLLILYPEEDTVLLMQCSNYEETSGTQNEDILTKCRHGTVFFKNINIIKNKSGFGKCSRLKEAEDS